MDRISVREGPHHYDPRGRESNVTQSVLLRRPFLDPTSTLSTERSPTSVDLVLDPEPYLNGLHTEIRPGIGENILSFDLFYQRDYFVIIF